jgi:hypothetical protein
MTEDSGAFKTNSRNPAQFRALFHSAAGRGSGASPAQETLSEAFFGHPHRRIVTNAGKRLRYSSISLIRARRRCTALSR